MRLTHRNLWLSLAFALGTAVAWNAAHRSYTQSVGVIELGNTPQHINLEHIRQELAANYGTSLEQWLGPQGAQTAILQQWKYRSRAGAALLCGFMAVFCGGLYLDDWQRRRAHAPTAVS